MYGKTSCVVDIELDRSTCKKAREGLESSCYACKCHGCAKAGIASLGPGNNHLGPHNVSFKTSMNFVTAYQGHTGHAGQNFHM